MNRLLSLAALGLAGASLPHMASAQSVTLEPGLYDISAVATLGGQPLSGADAEDCVRAGENDKTIEELLSNFSQGLKCTSSNLVQTDSTLTADFTCPPDASGFDFAGAIEAEFGSDYLKYSVAGVFGSIAELTVSTDMRRKGVCPADFVAPEPFK